MLNKQIISPNPFQKIYNISTKLVSVVFLINQNNKILMQLRDNDPNISCPNMWGPIGGHCENGESPYDCCIRELEEETSYKGTNIQWYKNHLINYDKSINNVEHYVSIFWTDYDNIQAIKCNEGQKMCFLDIDKLKQLNTLEHNISWI